MLELRDECCWNWRMDVVEGDCDDGEVMMMEEDVGFGG